jgi:energy-coupling factor transporter ATP-binding protein EcfA2
LDQARVPDPAAYPFCLPFLSNGFQLEFERPITVIVGENGTGKSTLLEGIAALAGYDEAGGGKVIVRSITRKPWKPWAGGWPRRCALRGCRRSPTGGSSAPRASFPLRAILTRRL